MLSYPQTRFQGSKARILNWIDKLIGEIDYSSVLDAFSGSGVVSYYFKKQNKQVTSNDILQSSYITALALVENSSIKINQDLIDNLLIIPTEHSHIIENNYRGIYYTDEENKWLDGFISNINGISNKYKRAMVLWALFQACIIKRPYNLFHRANLYMRTSEVSRIFGNKTTWDQPFPYYIDKFLSEANKSIFDNNKQHIALNMDTTLIRNNTMYDMIYIDPPYMKSEKKKDGNNYQNYYHFLEGIINYNNWENNINRSLKHLPYQQVGNNWIDPYNTFDKLFSEFQDSKIVLSYNSSGYPSPDQLMELIGSYKTDVSMHQKNIQYALNHKKSTEILIIGI